MSQTVLSYSHNREREAIRMTVDRYATEEKLRLIKDIEVSKKFSWKTFVKAIELYAMSL